MKQKVNLGYNTYVTDLDDTQSIKNVLEKEIKYLHEYYSVPIEDHSIHINVYKPHNRRDAESVQIGYGIEPRIYGGKRYTSISGNTDNTVQNMKLIIKKLIPKIESQRLIAQERKNQEKLFINNIQSKVRNAEIEFNQNYRGDNTARVTTEDGIKFKITNWEGKPTLDLYETNQENIDKIIKKLTHYD